MHRHDFLGAFVAAPIGRLTDAPLLPAMIFGTTFAQVGSKLLEDPFSTLLPLVLIANAVDWLYGVRGAYLRGDYDDERSKAGLHSKVGAVLVVLLIRALEFWGGHHGFVQTEGTLACIIGFALVLQDVRSIHRKREEMGYGPIPLLSPILDWLNLTLERLMPPAPPKAADPTQ